MKIYPAIDLMNGRCVRLSQGRFDSVTEYGDDPAKVAEGFLRAGAKSLHVVDLDGAREGSPQQFSVISQLTRRSGLKVQVGGGVRTLEQVTGLLEAGADRVVIGSLAVKNPDLTRTILKAVGPDKITLALDFRKNESGETQVATSGWLAGESIRVEFLIKRYFELGVSHFLCTDIARDGMLSGPDVALYENWQNQFPAIELQVSGGISDLKDLVALKKAGLNSAILGKSLYEGRIRLEEALLC